MVLKCDKAVAAEMRLQLFCFDIIGNVVVERSGTRTWNGQPELKFGNDYMFTAPN